MIVFISDLHFEDGTAGKHNVSRDAMTIFFEDLRWHVRRRGVTDLRIVLLGDIFDLLRTGYWFGVDPDERPWGKPSARGAALQAHTRAVLSRVAEANHGTFAELREQASALRSSQLDVTVTYLPGNHDRLVNFYPEARAAVRSILGLGSDPDPFAERFHCPRHGVLALHGHQFDLYNHEAPDADNPDGVPIGDPLTTELVTRIPASVMAAIKKRAPGLPAAELQSIQLSFESIEDVRPLSSVVEWLLSHVRNRPELDDAVHDGLDDALGEFKQLSFVRAWFDKHDTWNPNDAADRLQWLLWVAGHVSLKTASKVAPPLIKLGTVVGSADPYVQSAQGLIAAGDLQTHFVVMGHTHHAKQEALGVAAGPGDHPIRRVYLNTGTWRPCHHRCADGSGFLAWKEMTYTMVYAPNERSRHGAPSFETWSGTLDARGVTTCG